MTRGSPVAALVTALGTLEPSPEVAREIARTLGLSFETEDTDEQPAVSQRDLPALPVPPALTSVADDDLGDDEQPPSPRADAGASSGNSSGSAKKQLRLERTTEQALATHPRPTLATVPAGPVVVAALPLEPLLRPVVTRAVVGASLARRVPLGPIDVTPLVETIARRQPIRHIPRASVTGVAPTARVLIDCGPGMAPFARDASDLSSWVQSVASRDRTELLRFWQTPRKVGPSPRRAAAAPPPMPGTVVVALTDLGIARTGNRVPDLAQHWLDLDGELRGVGSSLVIFVPYPEARWPRSLVGRLALVRWDRRTSLVDVRSARPSLRGRA